MQRLAVLGVVAVVGGAVLGFVFAGSPSRIASGVSIDGVDVGGLTAAEARAKLEAQSASSRRSRSPSQPVATNGD